MCQCTRGGLSSASVCVLSGWSINPFSCSSPLQTCENSGSFLSCSLALAMILTSDSLDGNCHLTVLCPSTQVAGRGLMAARAFPSSRLGAGDISASLWQWAVVSLLCVQGNSFSKFLSGFYRDLFPYCFPALGMDASWISTDLNLWHIQADQYLGDRT